MYDINHINQEYINGQSFASIAESLGTDSNGLAYWLRKNGFVHPICLRRKELDPKIKELYLSGVSMTEITRTFNVSQNFVQKSLKRNGLKKRGISEAGKIRHARSTPQERKKFIQAAIDARKNNPESQQKGLRNSAKTVEKSLVKIGYGEAELANELRKRGIDFVQQKAVDIYNIDIMCGNVAVEVETADGCPHSYPRMVAKVKYLLSTGHHVICIRANKARKKFIDPTSTASHIISFINFASVNPPGFCEYRVIWGNGNLFSVGKLNGDNISIIEVPSRKTQTSTINYSVSDNTIDDVPGGGSGVSGIPNWAKAGLKGFVQTDPVWI